MDVILPWLRSNDCVTVPVENAEQISDAVALFEIMAHANGEFFDTAMLKYNAQDNPRLKMSNLKRLSDNIINYFSENFSTTLNDEDLPDLQLIAELSDEEELLKLIKLVVTGALLSIKREEFINNLMMLDTRIPATIMEITQEMIAKYPVIAYGEQVEGSNEGSNDGSNSELHRVDSRGHGSGEISLLRENVQDLQEEKERLQSENEDYKRMVDELREEIRQLNDLEPHTIPGKALFTATLDVKRAREEVESYENEMIDQRKEIDELKYKNNSLKENLEEVRITALSAQEWKDKANLLQHDADKSKKLELQIQSYQNKLSEVKSQMLKTEEDNQTLTTENAILKDKLKKSQYNAQTVKSESSEFANIQAHVAGSLQEANDKIAILESTCQQQLDQIHDLQDKIDDLEHNETVGNNLFGASDGTCLNSSLNIATSPKPENKDQVMKLQTENAQLKARYNETNKKKMELEAKLEAQIQGAAIGDQLQQHLKAFTETQTATAIDADKEKEYLAQINELLFSKNKLTDENVQLRTETETTTAKLASLEKQLQHEMGQGMGADFKENALKLQNLQNQVIEKENEMARVKINVDRQKKSMLMEHRLVTTFVHDFGIKMQKAGVAERLQSRGGQASYINQQRKQSNQRYYKSRA